MTKEQEVHLTLKQMLKQKYPGNYGVKIGMIKELRENISSDPNGKLLIRSGNYPSIKKFKSDEQVKLAKGLKKFDVNGQIIIALNEKNAIRKYKQSINK